MSLEVVASLCCWNWKTGGSSWEKWILPQDALQVPAWLPLCSRNKRSPLGPVTLVSASAVPGRGGAQRSTVLVRLIVEIGLIWGE